MALADRLASSLRRSTHLRLLNGHLAISQRARAVSGSSLGKATRTHYPSVHVDIPPSFLRTPGSSDANCITVTRLNFADSPLPGYAGAYAVVLDGVLSEKECAVLVGLAERSAQGGEEESKEGGWRPAKVNAGGGYEVFADHIRKGDRIIWDTQDLANRILFRCLLPPSLQSDLTFVDRAPQLDAHAVEKGERWKLVGPNERLRFLRYGVGEYFKPHCDGAFETLDGHRSFYTLHLYLNTLPNPAGADTGAPPPFLTSPPSSGGSTTFLAPRSWHKDDSDGVDVHRGLWVPPRAGRVLIFQQRELLHDGEMVKSGVKVTMRTDLMYERDR